MKILTVLGARPQFIKAGVVSREIKRIREEGEMFMKPLFILDSITMRTQVISLSKN